MNQSSRISISAAVFAMLIAAPVHAAKWHSVPADSSLEFVVTYEGQESVGRFGEFEAEAEIDPKAGSVSFLRVTVDVHSATLFSADLDEAIAEKEWFDSATYPAASYTGDVAQVTKGENFLANGKVTIKGVERGLDLPLHISMEGDRVQLSGSVTLSRLDFGIGTGDWMSDSSIAYGVNVKYKVLLQKKD